MNHISKFLTVVVAFSVLSFCVSKDASAQWVNYGPSVSFQPGPYTNLPGGLHYKASTGTLYAPGQGVLKSTGVYTPIGNGFYRNPVSNNIYHPNSGTYIQSGQPVYPPQNFFSPPPQVYVQPGQPIHGGYAPQPQVMSATSSMTVDGAQSGVIYHLQP